MLVTQPLGQNNPIAVFVYILPSTGLYLTQTFLECIIKQEHRDKIQVKFILFG